MNNWTAWVGVKFGTLTVEKYLGYQDRVQLTSWCVAIVAKQKK